MSQFPIELIVFSAFSISAIVFSLLVVEHKSLVYSALSLAFLGISNAALFALLGFDYIALFQISVYVGAAVMFILFSATLFREIPPTEVPMRAAAIGIAILVIAAIAAIFLPYNEVVLSPVSIPWDKEGGLARTLVQSYWFPFLVVALALITTLIEGITLARREEVVE